MRTWILTLSLLAAGCAPSPPHDDADLGSDDAAEEPAAEARSPGFYSDELGARLEVDVPNLRDIRDAILAPSGDRVYLSMGGYTCSMTETGTIDYDRDVATGETGATGDTGGGGFIGGTRNGPEEEVVGAGAGTQMLVASDGSLYLVDVSARTKQRLGLSGVTAAREASGVVTAWTEDGVLTQHRGDELLSSLEVEPGLRATFSGDDVLLSGDPARRVDARGRTFSLPFAADHLVGDDARYLGRLDDRLTTYDHAGTAAWSFDDGTGLKDMGTLPSRDLVWAHYRLRDSENQVVFFDADSGAIRAELVLPDAVHSVTMSDATGLIVLASTKSVQMYRLLDE